MFVWAAGVRFNSMCIIVCVRRWRCALKSGDIRIDFWRREECSKKTAAATTCEQRGVELESGYAGSVVVMSFIIFVVIVYQWSIFFLDIL